MEKCAECKKPAARLAMRDKDGAWVCVPCLLMTDKLTPEQRAHYREAVQR